MADNDGASNGRVTLAVLSTKLDVVIDQQQQMLDCQRADHDRVGKLESADADHARRIGELEDATKARTWETRIVEMLLAIAASIGLIKTS